MDGEVSQCQVKGDLVSMGLLLVVCVTGGLVLLKPPVEPRGFHPEASEGLEI